MRLYLLVMRAVSLCLAPLVRISSTQDCNDIIYQSDDRQHAEKHAQKGISLPC